MRGAGRWGAVWWSGGSKGSDLSTRVNSVGRQTRANHLKQPSHLLVEERKRPVAALGWKRFKCRNAATSRRKGSTDKYSGGAFENKKMMQSVGLLEQNCCISKETSPSPRSERLSVVNSGRRVHVAPTFTWQSGCLPSSASLPKAYLHSGGAITSALPEHTVRTHDRGPP